MIEVRRDGYYWTYNDKCLKVTRIAVKDAFFDGKIITGIPCVPTNKEDVCGLLVTGGEYRILHCEPEGVFA